jgi:hypothetical protein
MCWNPADIVATGKFWYQPDFTVPVPVFGNCQFFDVTAAQAPQARIYTCRLVSINTWWLSQNECEQLGL